MFAIDNYDFKGKRAIIRVDFNVPLNEKGEVTDDTRIRAAIPTIKKVLEKGGSVILMSHLGRPKKNPDPKYSLEQIVPAIEKNLGVKVAFAGDCMGEKAAEMAKNLKPGEVMLRLTAKGESPQDCQERMAPLFWDVRSRLGDCLYGVDVSSLEEVVITRLRQKGLTLSAAESCTGGLIAKRLTDVPGASAAFLGGVVSYTNAVKAGVLGVPRDLLEQYGPVSEPVARAMAEGVRRLTGSDLSVSVTGLAGPDGDDRGNPVGTVYLGLSLPGETLVRRLALGGDRPRIRLLAASSALDIIRRHLCDLPIEQE